MVTTGMTKVIVSIRLEYSFIIRKLSTLLRPLVIVLLLLRVRMVVLLLVVEVLVEARAGCAELGSCSFALTCSNHIIEELTFCWL